MKNHIPLFEDFIKKYGERIDNREFSSIATGTRVLYKGTRYSVVRNNGFVLVLKSDRGSEISVNYSQFNQGGAITESLFLEAEFNGKRVCIFPGRFQPFHLGHIAALREAAMRFQCPVVPIQIKSKNEESPFPDELLKKIGDAVAREYEFIEEYVLFPTSIKSVIPLMVKFLREDLNLEAIGIGSGSDRVKDYTHQIKYINSERSDVPVSEPFRLEMVDQRAPEGPSGTRVREAIKADDEKLFRQLTPKSIHRFYGEMKKYI
jgi:hypothetical protein